MFTYLSQLLPYLPHNSHQRKKTSTIQFFSVLVSSKKTPHIIQLPINSCLNNIHSENFFFFFCHNCNMTKCEWWKKMASLCESDKQSLTVYYTKIILCQSCSKKRLSQNYFIQPNYSALVRDENNERFSPSVLTMTNFWVIFFNPLHDKL